MNVAASAAGGWSALVNVTVARWEMASPKGGGKHLLSDPGESNRSQDTAQIIARKVESALFFVTLWYRTIQITIHGLPIASVKQVEGLSYILFHFSCANEQRTKQTTMTNPTPPPPSLRRLPLLTEINIFIFTVTFAILHVILRPTGLEPIVASVCVGNLFGLILPYLATIASFVHIFIRPCLECFLYVGAYEAIVLDYKYVWIGFVLLMNIAVAITDTSHRAVEGADYRYNRRRYLDRKACKFWDSCEEYLSTAVVPWSENATLDPNRQFIFACHPHGIHCTPLGQFHSKGTAFDKRFPGICDNKLSGIAASIVFKLPGVREFFLSLNYIDASRQVVEKALDANRSLFICTGSGEESLLTKQGEDILVLSRRRGFVRMALMYGCDIVPIFGVGNSDLFATYSWGMGVRMWMQKKLHISVPIFHGRYMTPLPYKVPMKVLVGEPLKVPAPKVRGEKPDDALVDSYLQKYIERVKHMHRQHTTNRKLTIR